ncbi:MAG TPA: hypothetical protein VEI06_11970 [Gemmatimonadaceae bacterium]|nr:hypothetical protein [Gemmatimonadaceae bacterium]
MNWKLILQLSVFGLAMGIATVFFIPSGIEPYFWLLIFLVSAYFIATRAPGNYFLHGVCVGLVNSVWVTSSHVLLFNQYLANHAREAAMMKTMPMPDSPRLMMALMGPVIGLISGIVLGIFAVIASKILAARAPAPRSGS